MATHLERYFAGISVKRLKSVETERGTSNQHEFNGTHSMKKFLGLEHKEFEASLIYAGKDEDEWLSVEDKVTWYDSRDKHPKRSEFRLYYRDNAVTLKASFGNILICALGLDGKLLVLIIDDECPSLEEILWLFGIDEIPGEQQSLKLIDPSYVNTQSSLLFNYIAESIGLEIKDDDADNWIDLLIDRFGARFPTTKELSQLALETLGGDINPIELPDEALICLVDREELLFKQLEKYIVARDLNNLASTWADDIDAFMKFSLGVQNRRKSRAGHALENHVAWILDQNSIDYAHGAQTEQRSRPDFLFPSSKLYHDTNFPTDHLTMLGVKTTCKDRWRQVLNEAQRIDRKHLLTLQPRISSHQTAEMERANLSLVLPAALHSTYSQQQAEQLMNLEQFISMVRERQMISSSSKGL